MMPVRSQKQWAWMAANKPEMLKEWQAEAPVEHDKLPERVAKVAKPEMRRYERKSRGFQRLSRLGKLKGL